MWKNQREWKCGKAGFGGHDRVIKHMSCCECMHSHNQASQNPNTNGGGTHEVPPLAEELLVIGG